MAKARATSKAKRTKAEAAPTKPRVVRAKTEVKAESIPPRRSSVPPKPSSIPPKASSVRPKAASVRPPPAVVEEAAAAQDSSPPASAVARWEERGDKDAYALDLLERLVRYYVGRASATSSEAMRSVAVVLSTLSLGLAASDDEQLTALGRAVRDLRKHPG